MQVLASSTGMNATVFSGALLLAVPIAVLGGLVSFFSPCVLPLVPGYLSYVTGVSGTDLAEAKRGRMVAGASSSFWASPPSLSPAARSSATSARPSRARGRRFPRSSAC